MSSWPSAVNLENIKVNGKPITEYTHQDLSYLSDLEWSALMKMPNVIGYVAVAQLLALPATEVRNATQVFIASENAKQNDLLQAQELSLTALQKATLTPGLSSPRPNNSPALKLKISTYSGKEKESLRRWFVELKTGQGLLLVV